MQTTETLMTTLSLKDAGFFGRAQLFQNLTYTFGPGDRIGLVALNGAGKTTFLRCLAGELEFSSGDSTMSRSGRIGYRALDEKPATKLGSL